MIRQLRQQLLLFGVVTITNEAGNSEGPVLSKIGAPAKLSNTYPPVQPIRKTDPPYPKNAMRPAIEMNEAGHQSAAVATPLPPGVCHLLQRRLISATGPCPKAIPT